MVDWEKYTRSLVISVAVYAVFFLFVFLPFLPKAAGLGLLSEYFFWIVIAANMLPLALFALYFRLSGKFARLAVMASCFLAVFLSVFFVLPLQL